MIRFRLKEQIADLQFRTGKRVTLDMIEDATGITRSTLSRIANQKGYNTTTDNLDKLCEYFSCTLDELAEHVEE